MTKDHVQTAIKEGIPFVIKMADREKYEVTDRYKIALGKSNVIVVGKDDMPHILPLFHDDRNIIHKVLEVGPVQGSTPD